MCLVVLDVCGGAHHPGLVDEEDVDRLGLQLLGEVAVDLVPGVLVRVLECLVDLCVGLLVAVVGDVVLPPQV